MEHNPNGNDVNGGQGTPVTPSSDTTPPAVTPTAPETTPSAPGGGGEGGDGHTVPYSRFKEVNDELATLKAEKAAQTLTRKDAGTGGTPPATTPSTEQPADVTARVQELAPHLRDQGFVTKEDLAVQARVKEAGEMAKAHDGSDGLPAFDVTAVTAFMKEKGMVTFSYGEAYKVMNHDAIVAKAVADATDANAGQITGRGGTGAFGNAPKKGAVTLKGVESMPLEQYKKNGGSRGLRDAVLSGQVTE
jgi:hypothetical protein